MLLPHTPRLKIGPIDQTREKNPICIFFWSLTRLRRVYAMRGRQMITTRAHRHQASPNLLVCLRRQSVPLGTVEIRCLQHRLPGRYRPFPPNFALFANWLGVPHAGVGTPPHANFIVNYPIFFMILFIPGAICVHGEFGELPMFVLLTFC